ncbi:MAG: DUF4476 domain-containing protein, partial [Bacteroidia bacterium]
ILFIQSTRSQNNNLIIYSPEGLKFTIILNGIRQNQDPETNVKITGLNAPNYQVKVIFANNSLDLDQNAYLMYAGNLSQNTEFTYAIVNIKGKHKLKMKSAAPINSVATASDPGQTVMVYTPTDPSGTSTTTTTTNTIQTTGNDGNVGINMNGTGTGVNINLTGNQGTVATTGGSTTTTTTTSTTYTTTGNTSVGNTSVTGNGNPYVLENYNGTYGCPVPMNNADFNNAKESIASKGFDESKLTIAKQIIGNNCLLCSQIKELMELMSFEQTKLDLAKFAWSHNLDKGNYYKLNDAFSFESSINELNQYTQSH